MLRVDQGDKDRLNLFKQLLYYTATKIALQQHNKARQKNGRVKSGIFLNPISFKKNLMKAVPRLSQQLHKYSFLLQNSHTSF